MTNYPRWKYFLIIFVIILGTIYALPNLYGDDPAIQISTQNETIMSSDFSTTVATDLSQAQIPIKSIQQENNSVLIRFSSTDTQLKAQEVLFSKLGDNYTIALNLAATTPHWLSAIGATPMKLGLDLRGGIHFLLAIDIDSLLQRRVNSDLKSMADELRQAHIRYHGMRLSKNNIIYFNFSSEKDLQQADNILADHFPEMQITTNTSDGNNQLTASLAPAALLKLQDYAIDQTTTILRNRINELGIAEPIVQRQGAVRIAVDLPGIQDSARAKQILGGTATLEFHLVDVDNDPSQAVKGEIPFGSTLYQEQGRPILLKNQIMLSGDSITGAVASIGEDGRPSVNIRLGGGGESLFYKATSENVGKPLAIVYVETKMDNQLVDGKSVLVPHKTERVINVATIQSALGNSFQITGISSNTEAQNLALLLRAGALPAPISIIEERTVGPSLGKENIKAGMFSVEIGLVLIIIFMGIYYRLFGLVADIALVLNLILMIAILSILGATLTLPSIAGIVLAVGMAVDANVLIFERIREEMRNGLSPQASIKAGYERAFATIVDANVTTLIAVISLFAIGTGAVKGFAITTIIGLLVSMFTAITVTRAIIQLVYGKRNIKKLSIGI